MNPLILPALYYNEEVLQREKTLEMLDSDELIHPDEYDLLHIYLFSAPTIAPYRELQDKENICKIHVDGTSFIIYLSPEQVLAKVRAWIMSNKQEDLAMIESIRDKTEILPSNWRTIHEPTKIQE